MQAASAQSQEDAAPASDTLVDLVALARYIGRKWWFVALCAATGLLIAIVYLNLATPKFTAEMRITPAGTPTSASASSLGGLGGLAALAGVSVRQPGEGASPFELYVEQIHSRGMAGSLAGDQRILREIFDKEWDEARRQFRDPGGPLSALRNLLSAIAGQPAPLWQAPDAARLQEYLREEIVVVPPKPRDPPISIVYYTHENPEFAAYLLRQIDRRADLEVRASALDRAERYAAHLSRKLAATSVVEHRRTLSEALLEQERAIMMASSNAPFSAVMTEPPVATRLPTSPNVPASMAIGLLLGLFAGLLMLAARFVIETMKSAEDRFAAA